MLEPHIPLPDTTSFAVTNLVLFASTDTSCSLGRAFRDLSVHRGPKSRNHQDWKLRVRWEFQNEPTLDHAWGIMDPLHRQSDRSLSLTLLLGKVLKVLPTEQLSPHHCPSGPPLRGAEGNSSPFLAGANVLHRCICKTDPSFYDPLIWS